MTVVTATAALTGCLSPESFDAHSQHVWDTAILMEQGGRNGFGSDYPLRTIRALEGRPRLGGDRVRDRARGTASIIAFAGLDHRQHVAAFGDDFIIRAISTVIGPEGRLTAWRPTALIQKHGNVWGSPGAMNRLERVSIDPSAPEGLSLPPGLDVMMLAGAYHALHMDLEPPPAAAAVNAAAFRALRPGGRYVILDRHAPGGTQPVAGGHGLDVENVIDEVRAAGFILEARTDIFLVPGDPGVPAPAAPTFEERRNGFMLRFRKPEGAAP